MTAQPPTETTRPEPPSGSSTWQDRLRAEHAELKARLQKLDAYLLALPDTPYNPHLYWLNRQSGLMHELESILASRIQLIDKEPKQ